MLTALAALSDKPMFERDLVTVPETISLLSPAWTIALSVLGIVVALVFVYLLYLVKKHQRVLLSAGMPLLMGRVSPSGNRPARIWPRSRQPPMQAKGQSRHPAHLSRQHPAYHQNEKIEYHAQQQLHVDDGRRLHPDQAAYSNQQLQLNSQRQHAQSDQIHRPARHQHPLDGGRHDPAPPRSNTSRVDPRHEALVEQLGLSRHSDRSHHTQVHPPTNIEMRQNEMARGPASVVAAALGLSRPSPTSIHLPLSDMHVPSKASTKLSSGGSFHDTAIGARHSALRH